MKYRIKYKDLNTPNTYSFGGNVQTNGANYSTGVTHIDAGGTHEESPYEGVPMGQDSEGTPNLVEEQEVMYNDYVFSQRLKVPKITRPFNGKKYQQYEQVLKKYSGKSYAEAVKKAEKDSGIDERPNDAIAKRGFESILEILMMSQEQERDVTKYPERAKQIKKMTPEEYQEYKDNRNEQEKQQEAQEEQARMQGPIPPELQQGESQDQQSISPEEQAQMQQAQMQQAQLQQQAMQDPTMQTQQVMPQGQPQMAAYGGQLYAEGGEIPVDQNMSMSQEATSEMPQNSMEEVPQEAMEESGQEEQEEAPFHGDTPAEEMSTKELNQTIDEIIQYAREHKDRELVKEARKAKRGSREDKEAFVDDAREDIAMQEEESAEETPSSEEAPAEGIPSQEAMQGEAQEMPQEAQMGNSQDAAAMAAMMGGASTEMASANAGSELNATDPMSNSYALGGSMNTDNPEGGSLSTSGKQFGGTESYYSQLTESQKKKLDRAILKYTKKLGLSSLSAGDLKILQEEQAKVLVDNKGKNFNYKDITKNTTDDAALTSILKDYNNDQDYYYGRTLGSTKLTPNSNGKIDVAQSRYTPIENALDYRDNNWYLGKQLIDKDIDTALKAANGVYDYKAGKELPLGKKYDFQKYFDAVKAAEYADPNHPEANYLPYNRNGDTTATNLERNVAYQQFWEDFANGYNTDEVQQALALLAEKTKANLSNIKSADDLRQYLFGEDKQYTVAKGKKAGVVNDGKEGYWHKFADGVLANKGTNATGYTTYVRKANGDYAQVERPENFDPTAATKIGTYTDTDGRTIDRYEVPGDTHNRNLVQTNSGTIWDIGNNTKGLETNPNAPYQDEESGLGTTTTTTWYKPKDATQQNNDPYPAFPEWGDWAQIGVNAGLGIANALTPVDYTNADALINASRNITYQPVHRTPLGEKLAYKPIDFNYLSNQMQAKANSTERALLNQSNGNRATAAANLLASNYQNQIAVGDALMKSIQQNRQHEADVMKFNRETDQYNSESGLKADMANQSASLQAQQARFNGLAKGYAMRQALEDAKNKTLSANIQGTLQGVNNLMHDRYNNKAAGWLARHNYNPGFTYEKALGTEVSDPRKALFPRKRNRGFNI